VFAILFCVVQNKFVCRANHWFFLVLSNDNVLGVIIRKIRLVVSYFWWMKIYQGSEFWVVMLGVSI
jgi:hypothetical protein